MAVLDFYNIHNYGGWTKLCAHPVIPKGTGFRFLSILGRCSRRNLSIPRPVPVEWVNPKRKTRSIGFKGFPLDFDGWDGSDIFLAGSTRHVFISTRLRDALYKAIGRDHLVRNAADCLITDTLPFGDLFPLLNDFHGLSKK